jgi:hypothetical protein
MRTAKTSQLLFRPAKIILSLLILGFCSLPDLRAEEMTKLGNFSPYKEFPNVHHISVIAWNAKVNVRVGGSESFVQSRCPEIWFLNESVVSPGYIFREEHGLKIRFTQHVIQPKALFPDIDVYHDGNYWKVTREELKPLFECKEEDKQAEIKDKTIWFENQKLGELSGEGTPGKWYSSPPDLDVVLADTFHDDLYLSLYDHSDGILCDWRGKVLQLHLDDHASLATGGLTVSSCRVFANGASSVDVKLLNCDILEATVQKECLVRVGSGHIAKASLSEVFGGKVLIAAQVDKPYAPSLGITSSQKVIKKQTPRGTILQFPNYGNFDLK